MMMSLGLCEPARMERRVCLKRMQLSTPLPVLVVRLLTAITILFEDSRDEHWRRRRTYAWPASMTSSRPIQQFRRSAASTKIINTTWRSHIRYSNTVFNLGRSWRDSFYRKCGFPAHHHPTRVPHTGLGPGSDQPLDETLQEYRNDIQDRRVGHIGCMAVNVRNQLDPFAQTRGATGYTILWGGGSGKTREGALCDAHCMKLVGYPSTPNFPASKSRHTTHSFTGVLPSNRQNKAVASS